MSSITARDLVLLVALALGGVVPPVATVVSLVARRPLPAWFGTALAALVGIAIHGAVFDDLPTWMPDLRRPQSWLAPAAVAWTLAAIAAGRVLVGLRLADPSAERTPRRALAVLGAAALLSVPVAFGTSGLGCVTVPLLAALALGGLRADPAGNRDPAAAELVGALAVCLPPTVAWWAFGTPTPGWPALPLLAGVLLGSRVPDLRPAALLGCGSVLATAPYFRGWLAVVAWESAHALPRSSEPAEQFDPTPALAEQRVDLVDAGAIATVHEAVLARNGAGMLVVVRRMPDADEVALWVTRAGPDAISVEGGPPVAFPDLPRALEGSRSGCNRTFVRIGDPEHWTEQEIRDLCMQAGASGCGVADTPPELRCGGRPPGR